METSHSAPTPEEISALLKGNSTKNNDGLSVSQQVLPNNNRASKSNASEQTIGKSTAEKQNSIEGETEAHQTTFKDKVYKNLNDEVANIPYIPLKDEEVKTIHYPDPILMLGMYDENIRDGTVILYQWQVRINEFIGTQKASAKHPLKLVLCAANGSGKDSFFIAPTAVWFILTKLKARVVITSSSGTQLTNQTEVYIRNLCEKINKYHGEKVFKVNQRYIRCNWTGSEIRMFATDEPGKAEGYHPIEPNAPMMLIQNEAKSIPDEIDDAMRRCTGYSHWLKVSSPAEPKGHFYKAFNNWPYKVRITSYDCPEHLSKEDIECDRAEVGEHSALFRSKHLALFTTVGGQVVISQDNILKCLTACGSKWTHKHWPKRVGLDLAAGGDENVISIWQGNKCIFEYTFVEKDTTISAEIISRILEQHVPKEHDFIRADDGGVGRGIIDQLVRRGWNIKRILNQHPAYNKREFGNRGAEMWFRFSRLIQECLINLNYTNNKKFLEQLYSRYYRKTESNGRIYLQSKAEAKAEGHPSPDRADAAIIANCDLTVESFLNDEKGFDANYSDNSSNVSNTANSRKFNPLNQDELIEYLTKIKYANFNVASFRRNNPTDYEYSNTHIIPPEQHKFNDVEVNRINKHLNKQRHNPTSLMSLLDINTD